MIENPMNFDISEAFHMSEDQCSGLQNNTKELLEPGSNDAHNSTMTTYPINCSNMSNDDVAHIQQYTNQMNSDGLDSVPEPTPNVHTQVPSQN